MGYYIDLKSLSIDHYKEVLKTTELIPSWKILGENIDKNLDIIKEHNIKNLEELLAALKDKGKIQELSNRSGLPVKYLEVLNRVVKGYRQKPNKLKDFSCIPEEVVNKLEKSGIKNTLKLYDKILTPQQRNEFAQETGLSKDEILKLAKLTDLSRIRWVNHTFAHVLLEAGYDKAEKIADADYQTLYSTVKQLNAERKIYNAQIGERDMKMIIESARSLEFEVEY